MLWTAWNGTQPLSGDTTSYPSEQVVKCFGENLGGLFLEQAFCVSIKWMRVGRLMLVYHMT
jgi:hypothetical protein